jgi:hypothetical protein
MPPSADDIAKLEERLAVAHSQADSLLIKLQAIKAIADQLPPAAFLDEVEARLNSIGQRCAVIQGPMMSAELPQSDSAGPTTDDLNLLATRLGEIVGGLQQFAAVAERLAADVGAKTGEVIRSP